MPNVRAGDYRYRLTRQIPQTQADGSTVYNDDIVVWAAVDEFGSLIASGAAAGSIVEAKQIIRIRNKVTINPQDRLIDYATGYIYLIDGLYWDFPNNQIVINAVRQDWLATK